MCDINIDLHVVPLLFKITLNNTTIFEFITNESSNKVSFDIPNIERKHSMKFILSGKTDCHTILDDGNVIKSSQVSINNIAFGGIDIRDILLSNKHLFMYTHDKNGYGEMTTEPFNFCMGYNGTAEFKFSSPVLPWLLELT